MRNFLARIYRIFDRILLSHLPEPIQHFFVSHTLNLARIIWPNRAWPSSAASFLARRTVKKASIGNQKLPLWAQLDMADLSLRVDPLLSPKKFKALSPRAHVMPIHWTQAGEAYYRIRDQIRGLQFDTVLLVPWLVRGGADLAAIHHARACHEAFNQRTLVISTEPRRSPWATRLPKGVHFLQIGNDVASLSQAMSEPEAVLARLLIQLAPTRIHIINSRLAWKTVEKYGLPIKQNTLIYASLYCDDHDPSGIPEGLAQEHLPNVSKWLNAIITDNSASPEEWIRTLGIDQQLLHVVHFPAPAPHRPVATQDGSTQRVLWAGRLERQKRPELLEAIVKATPELNWDIHGTVPSGKNNGVIKRLGNLSNAKFHGRYDSFDEIVDLEHLAFVYTSAWDGLPNVLLEASSAGLVVVAPDIGGIRDLFPRALLLPPDSDAEIYADAIRSLTDPEIRNQKLIFQQEQLIRFTWENFVYALKSVPGYV